MLIALIVFELACVAGIAWLWRDLFGEKTYCDGCRRFSHGQFCPYCR